MATCWKCGTEVDRGAVICPGCGATGPARGRPEVRADLPIHRHLTTLRPVWIGLGVLLVAIVAGRACAAM